MAWKNAFSALTKDGAVGQASKTALIGRLLLFSPYSCLMDLLKKNKKESVEGLKLNTLNKWANVLRDQLLFLLLGSFQSAENTVFPRAGAWKIRGRDRLICFESNFLSYLITTFKMRYFHLKYGSYLGKKKVFSSLPFLIFFPALSSEGSLGEDFSSTCHAFRIP